jgi:hypothetical protein
VTEINKLVREDDRPGKGEQRYLIYRKNMEKTHKKGE